MDPAHAAWAAIAPDASDRLDAHLEILIAACNALHFAHSRGIIHRDIKLSNLMIGSFGEVYVVDWGIAVHTPVTDGDDTGPGALAGTPAYMAPEMARGDLSRIDARTDVYLLGATLHAALTGQPRHQGESIFEVLLSASESLPYDYSPDVPAELAALCNRAMSADPGERFSSALDLRHAVGSFRRHRGSIALSDEAARRLAELRALDASADERRVHAMMTECRFGFTQALRSWPENAAARAGRETCLALMIEHEIAQRDAEGARVLYAELVSERPDLLTRIETLAAELAVIAEHEARLRSLEHNRNLGIGGRAQIAFVATLPVIAIGASAYLLRRGDMKLSPSDFLSPPALIANIVLFAAYFVVRSRVRTEISRKALALLVLTPLAWLVQNVFALVLGGSMPLILAVDMLIASLMGAALAITLVPRIGWTVGPAMLSALAILAWPNLSVPIFTASWSIGLIFVLILWRRAVKA